MFEKMQIYGYYNHQNVLTSHLTLGFFTIAFYARLIVLGLILWPLKKKYATNEKILKVYNKEVKNLLFDLIL